MVHLSQLRINVNISLLTKVHTSFRFSLFLLNALFLSQDPIQNTKLHLFIILLEAPLGCQNFSDFPCFWWPLEFWGVMGQYFVSSGWYFVDFEHIAEPQCHVSPATPFTLLPQDALWREVTLCSSYLRSRVMLLLLQGQYYINCLEFFCIADLSLLPLIFQFFSYINLPLIQFFIQ